MNIPLYNFILFTGQKLRFKKKGNKIQKKTTKQPKKYLA